MIENVNYKIEPRIPPLNCERSFTYSPIVQKYMNKTSGILGANMPSNVKYLTFEPLLYFYHTCGMETTYPIPMGSPMGSPMGNPMGSPMEWSMV